jgi:nitroreductase
MLKPNDAAMAFLLTRRSRPAKTLTGPVPDREALEVLLTAAARSPDHGKLEPWRFIVLQDAALARLAELVPQRGLTLELDDEQITKAVNAFLHAQLVVAVIASPKPSLKVPKVEQSYSAGAVCLSLVNASLAAGWGANCLSVWASHDRAFVEYGLGLSEQESVAGFIHIGTETTPPPERPRPDIEALTEWCDR